MIAKRVMLLKSKGLGALLALIATTTTTATMAHAKNWNDDYDKLTPKHAAGEAKTGRLYRVEVGDLRPTQFSVGLTEVNERVAHMRKLGKHELRHYLKDHAGSVVVGPGGDLFLVDGHHVTLALSRLEGDDSAEMLVRVLADWSNLTRDRFFARMERTKRMRLFDENGKGPKDPETLPRTVHGLKNDPYRSIAYLVRKAGGIKDLDIPFLEFAWADYFRERIARARAARPTAALARALELAREPEARGLPGYEPHPPKSCEAALTGQP